MNRIIMAAMGLAVVLVLATTTWTQGLRGGMGQRLPQRFGAFNLFGTGAQSSTKEQAAGRVRVNPRDGLKYVWIPAGTFQMGCSVGDFRCADDEKPSHQVKISKGFWTGETEVTVGAYKRFAKETGKTMPPELHSNNGGWSNESMPMVGVTWSDGQAYCTWAGGLLPTEAQWEYAARGGAQEGRYGPIDEIAWFESNSGDQAHQVGEKRANGFGLFDTLGNVWEWVSDWYEGGYYFESPSENPGGPSSGRFRVLRGGSWYLRERDVRVSYRLRGEQDAQSYNVGVRCVGELGNP